MSFGTKYNYTSIRTCNIIKNILNIFHHLDLEALRLSDIPFIIKNILNIFHHLDLEALRLSDIPLPRNGDCNSKSSYIT
jgi:hypothetical protein